MRCSKERVTIANPVNTQNGRGRDSERYRLFSTVEEGQWHYR